MVANNSSLSVGQNRKLHILVIRLSAMGDVAMMVPVVSALIQQHPSIKVTILTRGFFKPLFSQFPNVNIHIAEVKGRHKGVWGLWRLYRELKTLNISKVADLHNVLRTNILKRYFALNKIPFVQIDKGRAEKKRLTATSDKIFSPLKTTHKRYASVFSDLGFPINLSESPVLNKYKLSKKTLDIVGSDTKKWIGIAPFAAYSIKVYPLFLMEKVVSKLNDKGIYKIIFFGGGKEEKEQLENWANRYKYCINSAGVLSFKEELGLISNLDVMLAMDSGNAHLAAMFGIPTVTLWGVTHPYSGFYPFGQDIDNAILANREKYPLIPTSVYGNKFPKGYEKVMECISPQSVYEKLVNLLSIVLSFTSLFFFNFFCLNPYFLRG